MGNLYNRTVEELHTYAEEQGIDIDKRWGKDKLVKSIEKAYIEETSEAIPSAPPKPPQNQAYRNTHSTDVYMFGKRIDRGMTYVPTEADLKDERGLKHLARAIALGLIEKV
jgi:hypothetical protein